MTYRVEFEGAALVQLNGLPSAAFDALVERVVALVKEPWDAASRPGSIAMYWRVLMSPACVPARRIAGTNRTSQPAGRSAGSRKARA